MAMVYCDMGDNLTRACRTEEPVNKPEHDGASRQMPID